MNQIFLHFYACGNTDTAYNSSDALTWTALTSLNTGVSDGYFSIAANNGALVAYSATPEVGTSWVNRTSGTENLFDISARALQLFSGGLAPLN